MKKSTLSVAITLLATNSVAFAAEDNSFYGITPSASVALTTDYIWRGVSQTANAPAIQGSFDLSHESGLYIGAWASNIEFKQGATHETGMELDIYAGFANEIDLGGVALSYDLGWLRYEYPNSSGSTTAADNWNFNELYFGLGVSPIENLNVSAYYYYGLRIENTNPGDYREVAADYTLPAEFGGITFLASAGQYDVVGGDDYWNWKIGASKEIAGFNVEVGYTDTDDTGAGNDTDDGKVYATISREFGADSNGGLALPGGFDTSASVALTTDYIWRGVSQTANAPAIQGSFDIAHESGAYIGVWGSNVEFGGPDNSLELDIYAGFSNDIAISDAFSITYDLGWLRYEYPTSGNSTTASGYNFNELYAGLAISPIENLNLSAYYYYGLRIENTNPGDYRDFNIDYTTPDELGGITLLAHAGQYDQTGGLDDYWDWKLGIAKDIGAFNVEVAYTDTDDVGTGYGDTDDGKVIGTISASF